MKNLGKILLAGTISLTFAGCQVEQTKEGEMPDVDVNASGGQMPEFNVQGPDVDVGTENRTVQVPTIDVDVPGGDNDANDNKAE